MTMTKSILKKLQYLMLLLMIVTIPIISMPKAYKILGFGSKLYLYPLLIGVILFIFEAIKFKNKLNLQICKYLLLLIFIQFTITFYGILKFPYYSDINILTNEKNVLIANFLNIGLADNLTLFKYVFMFLRSVKIVISEFIVEWLLLFWVFHLFQNDFSNGFKKIRSMFIILAILLSIYAIPEVLLFKFNMQIGYDILCYLNPYLYDVGNYLNWYPPIIYPNHGLKSYCIEPGFMGLLAATILPFLFSFIFQYKKNILLYIFYSYFMMILFMTKARTANVIIYIYSILFLCYSAFFRNLKKYALLILLTCMAFLGAVFEISDIDQNLFTLVDTYYTSNIDTIMSTTARSNGSRLNNILIHLNVFKDNLLFGTGPGLKDLYIVDSISGDALKEIELKAITEGIRSEGMFKYSYGNVNHYTYILTNYGLVGFTMYFLPFLFAVYKVWRSKAYVNKEIAVLLIALLLNLVAMMVGNPFSVVFIILGLLYVKVFNNNIIKKEEI